MSELPLVFLRLGCHPHIVEESILHLGLEEIETNMVRLDIASFRFLLMSPLSNHKTVLRLVLFHRLPYRVGRFLLGLESLQVCRCTLCL